MKPYKDFEKRNDRSAFHFKIIPLVAKLKIDYRWQG